MVGRGVSGTVGWAVRMVHGKVIRVACRLVSGETRRLVSRMSYGGWSVCRTLIVIFVTPRVVLIEFFILKIPRIV